MNAGGRVRRCGARSMTRNGRCNDVVLSMLRLSPLAGPLCPVSSLPLGVTAVCGSRGGVLNSKGNGLCNMSTFANGTRTVGPFTVHSGSCAGGENFGVGNSACLGFVPVGKLAIASHLSCHLTSASSCNIKRSCCCASGTGHS